MNTPSICTECNKDEASKQDQLIPCTSCAAYVHTTCEGFRRIPFTLKTEKERQNREKYIKKHYSTWICKSCTASDLKRTSPKASTDFHNSIGMAPHSSSKGIPHTGGVPALSGGSKGSAGGTGSGLPNSGTKSHVPSSSSSFRPTGTGQTPVSSPDNSGAGAGASWMSPAQHTRSVQPHPQSPVPPHVQTKHDQAAALMGLLAASGLTMDALMAMGEEKQKEALIAAATYNNSSRSESHGQNSNGSISSGSSSNTNTVGSINDDNNTNGGKSLGSTGSMTAGGGSLPTPPEKATPVDPRNAMMDMLAKRADKTPVSTEVPVVPASAPAPSSSTPGESHTQLQVKLDYYDINLSQGLGYDLLLKCCVPSPLIDDFYFFVLRLFPSYIFPSSLYLSLLLLSISLSPTSLGLSFSFFLPLQS